MAVGELFLVYTTLWRCTQIEKDGGGFLNEQRMKNVERVVGVVDVV